MIHKEEETFIFNKRQGKLLKTVIIRWLMSSYDYVRIHTGIHV